MRRVLTILAAIVAGAGAMAQSVSTYDDFGGAPSEAARWALLNEDGAAQAGVQVACGTLSIAGVPNRAGLASHARIPETGAVEADAIGWTGTNQILQLTSGTGALSQSIEFFPQGEASDGTPILHVWLPSGEARAAVSPVPGIPSPENPTTLRIERSGITYRFLANGRLFHTFTTAALAGDARVFLYGWQDSVGHWDAVRMSGPAVGISAPAQGATISGPIDVLGRVGDGAASWRLEWGSGAAPTAWTAFASGAGPASGVLARWSPAGLPNGAYTIRLSATGTDGAARTYWTAVTLEHATLWEPLEGQRVGGAFTAAVQAGGNAARVRFYDNGVLAAESASAPFWGRIHPTGDGPHAISATVVTASGTEIPVLPVNVTVQRDLFGGFARLADDGRAFVLPGGATSVAIGQNNGYTWYGCYPLWNNGDAAATESYVAAMAASGVNVIRMFLESAWDPGEFLENPIYTFNPKTVAFWDRFLPICQRYRVSVLISPWDTYWINLKWSQNPYNAANGGPCATVQDFIVSPLARQAQKNRIRYMVDRWGNSPAIFAFDILNEYDIWWDTVTDAERNAWVDDMAAYLQNYEVSKWGHRHMTTVSSTRGQPAGLLADTVYRHPRFDFANTHSYYPAVASPANIIDPALAIDGGVRYAFGQIRDGRPFMETEWGPIDVDGGLADRAFDDQYFHHFSWAHFASGGAGSGMRWPMVPSSIPYTLTAGMRATQKAIAQAAGDIAWARFRPENIDARISTGMSGLISIGASDGRQAILWVTQDVRSQPATTLGGVTVTVTGFADGRYLVRAREPYTGAVQGQGILTVAGGVLRAALPQFGLDQALTVRQVVWGDANGDMALTVDDVAECLRLSAGLAAASPAGVVSADVTGDGRVGAADALAIARAVAGLAPAK